MDNNKKLSEPVEEERWALKEVNTMKNPLAVQILALSIQILALVVILLKKYTLNVYFPVYNVQTISSERGLLCMSFSNSLLEQIFGSVFVCMAI